MHLLRIPGETINPKYEALPIEPIVENKVATNCYWAKLDIRDLQKEDARVYTLIVESDQGRDSTNLKLIVRDPMEMRLIAAVAAVGLLMLLLMVSFVIYSLLRVKHRRYKRKEEEGSIAADAFYNTTATATVERHQKSGGNANVNGNAHNNSSKNYCSRKPSQEGGLAVMYDYDQITKQQRAMSPEALKVRRAPAVLQPPTIV